MKLGGLDIGQKVDHTALVCLGSGGDGVWYVESAQRLPLGLSFRQQLGMMETTLQGLDALIVDTGGTGQAVVELLEDHPFGILLPAVITAGMSAPKITKGRLAIGKARLVSILRDMTARRQLKVRERAPGSDILRAELDTFMYSDGGRFKRMEAKIGKHDDVVMALALVAYLAATQSRA